MKRINTGIILTATLVTIYITLSRAWAISHLIVKNMKPLASEKALPAANATATKAA